MLRKKLWRDEFRRLNNFISRFGLWVVVHAIGLCFTIISHVISRVFDNELIVFYLMIWSSTETTQSSLDHWTLIITILFLNLMINWAIVYIFVFSWKRKHFSFVPSFFRLLQKNSMYKVLHNQDIKHECSRSGGLHAYPDHFREPKKLYL